MTTQDVHIYVRGGVVQAVKTTAAEIRVFLYDADDDDTAGAIEDAYDHAPGIEAATINPLETEPEELDQ